jgi:hypothetical protein
MDGKIIAQLSGAVKVDTIGFRVTPLDRLALEALARKRGDVEHGNISRTLRLALREYAIAEGCWPDTGGEGNGDE